MKRILFAISLLTLTAALSAQRATLDDFFGRYDDREGYTSIIINGSILKSFVCSGQADDQDDITGKITSIRLVIRDKDKCKDSDAMIPELRNIIRRGSSEGKTSNRTQPTSYWPNRIYFRRAYNWTSHRRHSKIDRSPQPAGRTRKYNHCYRA